MITEKLKILKGVLGHGYQSGHEHLFHCPFCDHHKKKLSVNVERGFFKCWICDKSGRDVGYIVRKFGTRQDRDEWSKYDDRVEITDFDFLFAEPEAPSEQRIDLPEQLVSLTGKTTRCSEGVSGSANRKSKSVISTRSSYLDHSSRSWRVPNFRTI